MKKLLYTLLLITLSLNAQETVSISLHQDTRLAFLGDDHGNKPGTVNIVARLKMQGDQEKWGYMMVFPEFEYANIDGQYKRWSANIGYTFNRLIIDNVEVSASFGWGWIDRWGLSTGSISTSGELAYKINCFKISLLGQITDRTDLLLRYGNREMRFSGFIGLEFNL
jgi:acyl-CoA-binding protein